MAPSVPAGGFHRRYLPAPAIGFSTAEGKALFRAALAAGGAEVYFKLAEAFRTQDEPAWCGLGCLVTVLNALEVDPGALWKGAWRWYDESMLGCCVDLEEIKEKGIGWRAWLCLAACQGLHTEASRASESSLEAFRAAVLSVTASDDRVLCVNYSRRVLGQAGDGHYSPIGAYLPEQDVVLVLDVARFKHPPHWLPLQKLWEAMGATDSSTNKTRGYAILSRKYRPSAGGCILTTVGRGRLSAVERYFRGSDASGDVQGAGDDAGMAAAAAHPSPPVMRAQQASLGASTPEEELWLVMRSMPSAVAALVSVRDEVEVGAEEAARVRLEAARGELRRTKIYQTLASAEAQFKRRDGPLPDSLGACTALLLTLPAMVPPQQLRASLPRTAGWCEEEEEPLLRGAGALVADVHEVRQNLAAMHAALCCGEEDHDHRSVLVDDSCFHGDKHDCCHAEDDDTTNDGKSTMRKDAEPSGQRRGCCVM